MTIRSEDEMLMKSRYAVVHNFSPFGSCIQHASYSEANFHSCVHSLKNKNNWMNGRTNELIHSLGLTCILNIIVKTSVNLKCLPSWWAKKTALLTERINILPTWSHGFKMGPSSLFGILIYMAHVEQSNVDGYAGRADYLSWSLSKACSITPATICYFPLVEHNTVQTVEETNFF